MNESLLDTQKLPPLSADPNKNYLPELVGEGKKFKSPEELARGKFEADVYIESKNRQYDNLLADYQKLRDEYNAGPKLQEVVDKLLAVQTSSSNTNTQSKEENSETPAFDPSKLDSLVEQKVGKFEADRKAQENWNMVKEKLQTSFGERFPEMVAAQTQKLGLTADKVNDLARTAPQAFFKVMGLDEPAKAENFQAPPASSRRSDNFSNNAQKRTLSYYENLRKEKPLLYYDKKIAVQMDKDSQALGEAFFDV